MSKLWVRVGSVCILVIACGEEAVAQVPAVVQLPSFQTFSYQGSVLVPDRGATSLGGIRRASSADTNRGASRSLGGSVSHSHASIHATIIDLDAIDREILGEDFRTQFESTPARFTFEHRIRAATALVRLARRQFQDGQRSLSASTYESALAQLRGAVQLAGSRPERSRASSLLTYATAERDRLLPSAASATDPNTPLAPSRRKASTS
ncbi:MAG: hypothetical protein AAGD07_22115 [Planctomycetota bacterium]